MRRLVLFGLTACWSSMTLANPPPPPAPKYVLPAAVSGALSSERLAKGMNVAVPSGVTLHPTLAAARTATQLPAHGIPMAMTIVRDHGDIVELSTASAGDCVASWDEPYKLTVFVARAALYPRTKVEVVRMFADGTGVAIDRGAPVDVSSERGLVWEHGLLASTRVAPDERALTYAVPATPPSAALPSAALPPPIGDRMVCENDTPTTIADGRAARARERAEQYRREDERRRAEAEARRIEEAKKPKPKPKAKKKSPSSADELDGPAFAELLVGDGTDSTEDYSRRQPGIELSREIDDDERYLRFCGVVEKSRYDVSTTNKPAPPPTVNGKPMPWPSFGRDIQNNIVYRSNGKYLGDVAMRCGSVRMAVDHAGVNFTGSGARAGSGERIQVWVPAPGPVTWPDGKSAGRYEGSKHYREVVEDAGRICVRVTGVAERVCHPKKTTKQEMGYRDFD